MPSFVVFEEDQRQFRIQTDDNEDVGKYTVNVECKIEVPDNPEKSSYTEWK